MDCINFTRKRLCQRVHSDSPFVSQLFKDMILYTCMEPKTNNSQRSILQINSEIVISNSFLVQEIRMAQLSS